MTTTRSLTKIFINFRDASNASGSSSPKKIDYKTGRGFRNHKMDDTVALVSDEDLEHGQSSLLGGFTSLPPEWTTAVEEVQYDVSKIQNRIKDLTTLHNKHLNRPSMDDSVNEEHTIDVTTQEITQLFHQCQRCIQSIQGQSSSAHKAEKLVVRNVVSSLAQQLQDLSQTFKKGQSTYLKRMKNREDREKQYFDNSFQPTNNDFMMEDDQFEEMYDKGFTTAQLRVVEENQQFIKEREEEITHIVQSIGDLNMIFKDLSILVIDQGTILDRIDYNVEQASVQVDQGLQQLQKGEKYQKKNRKMMCILVLSAILIIMIVALVLVKG